MNITLFEAHNAWVPDFRVKRIVRWSVFYLLPLVAWCVAAVVRQMAQINHLLLLLDFFKNTVGFVFQPVESFSFSLFW